jgi:hypothetical protein
MDRVAIWPGFQLEEGSSTGQRPVLVDFWAVSAVPGHQSDY